MTTCNLQTAHGNYRPFIETLEIRHLLSADLDYGGFVGGMPVLFRAGETILPSYTILNRGDTVVARSFYVQFRLIPVGLGTLPALPDFYHPNAIHFPHVRVDSDIPTGALGTFLRQEITYPSVIPPGLYVMMSYLDSTGAIAELNESNNYHVWSSGQGAWALTVEGLFVIGATAGDDAIDIGPDPLSPGILTLRLNDRADTFSARHVTGFDVRGGAGNDVIVTRGLLPSLRIDGQDGNDIIVGGDGNDFLVGGAGKDRIFGGLGNDRLNGNGGHDRLYGEAGSDRLYGYAGNDYLDGASSSDRLEGGAGSDTMFGQGGNDRFFTRDGEIDELFGASGTDQGQTDDADILSSVNIRLP